MIRTKLSRLIPALILMTLIFSQARAQYTVSGGKVAPLPAVDDTPNRLQVWLVYGVEDVRISCSASPGAVWKRYATKALEAETITEGITSEGSLSVLTEVADGYGYFLEEPGALSRYIWIIDYSRHAVSLGSIGILANDNPCEELWLTGDADISPLVYFTPIGLRRELQRQFEVTYNTMEWAPESRSFVITQARHTIEGDPFEQALPPPMSDTEIRLQGDLFARHFGVEQSAVSPTFQAVAVAARIDTLVTSSAGANIAGQGSGFSAPLFVNFRPAANEPAANWFRWTIYHQDKRDTIRASTVRDMDFTFTEAGTYTIGLEVADRSRKCMAVDSISIAIGESYLHVPNAFSPGASPGVNDVFKVAYKSLISFNGWIFNRWGAELFRWSDPTQGWDGKKGGAYVPPGVYFYVIEAKGSDGKNYKEKGHINIIRPKNVRDQISE
ncbi:MAG: gliding motility-associated C-terminal domain-containing protein [Tannerellaceae bacterium]|jgi:gliding motility-associated-like protein|nr:gliding motility-associated C-terminal domain-containing protein [Tannerellaceae bacterium]